MDKRSSGWIVCGLLGLIFMLLNGRFEQVRAAEIFGDAIALRLDTVHADAGLVLAHWAPGEMLLFIFAESDGRGYMVQVWGAKVAQYGPYEQSNEWAYYYERQLDANWSGRVEFRGHYRPFCGGDSIPKACMWK